MKDLRKLFYLLLGISVLSSCEDFMDIHKKYIEGGEIIYAPKPDTISFIAGKERIQFHCRAYNAPNVKEVNLYWNDGLDSLIIPVSFGAAYDSIEVILNNMEEKSYTFNVVMVDNYGHKSLTVTDFGTSYGTAYQSTLNDRRIKELTFMETGGVIEWYSPMDGLVRNEIRYTKSDGTQAEVWMPADAYSVTLPSPEPGSSFMYRSLYIPEEQAIDTFATDWVQSELSFPQEYKYDCSSWKVLAVSDETASDGGGANSLIDDDLSTYWHSSYTDGDAPLPHWAVIDMQAPKKISRLEVYRRAGNTDAKTVEIYVSDQPEADADGWQKIGTGVFADGDAITVQIAESVDTTKGRYLKLLLPDSNRPPFTSIAEVFVYGR